MKRKNKKIIKYALFIFCIVLIIMFGYKYYKKDNSYSNAINTEPVKINYDDFYNDFVKVLKDKKIYEYKDNDYHEIGEIFANYSVALEKDDCINDGYFKLKDFNYYIKYDDLEKIDSIEKDDSWKIYIPFNESIQTNDKTIFYLNGAQALSINLSINLPIIIKDNDYYGVEYMDSLLFVKKDECDVIENHNTELKHTDQIAALTYHFVYDSSDNEEKNKCLNMNSTICLSDTTFDSHLKYLKENNFYTPMMNEVEMFVDGKIQLPEKTVLLTIDDGNFVSASIKVLEKYDMHATLFLIGIAGSPDNYKSDNLEIHSHTWDMHKGGICPGGQGSEIKCLPKEEIQEDLKKSRDSLNNTTYFCWPFFEYNDYAIENVKEAGFTMAFIGGRRKIKPGMNKLLLPRYGIINTTTVSDIARIVN